MEQAIKRTLTVNSLNDDMIKMAVEHGYKLPAVSIKHYYGKSAAFVDDNGAFSLAILRENALINNDEYVTSLYLITDASGRNE